MKQQVAKGWKGINWRCLIKDITRWNRPSFLFWMHSREWSAPDQRGATALVGTGAPVTAFVQWACVSFATHRLTEENRAALLLQSNFGLTNPLKGSQEATHCEKLGSSWVPQHTPLTPAPRTLWSPDLHFDFWQRRAMPEVNSCAWGAFQHTYCGL